LQKQEQSEAMHALQVEEERKDVAAWPELPEEGARRRILRSSLCWTAGSRDLAENQAE